MRKTMKTGRIVTWDGSLSRDTNADILAMADSRKGWDELKRSADPGRRYRLGTMAMIAGRGLPLGDWLELVEDTMNLEPLPAPHAMVGQQSPWGRIDSARDYGDGIVQVTTGSHGGFRVRADLNEQIPLSWQYVTHGQLGRHGWYEEDCDWSIVAVTFTDRFDMETWKSAMRTFHQWIYPKIDQEA